jgi:DeoR family fructose operon transcriptional repressor
MTIDPTAQTLFAVERRRLMVERLKARGRLDAADLAREFDVTSETVRRDLAALAELGLLQRVHGGALPAEVAETVPDLDVRTGRMPLEKEWIAATAAKLLPTTGAVFIDAGSTTLGLADHVPQRDELTIVTNSLPLAMVLAARGGPTVKTLGGAVRGSALAEVGPWAIQNLASLHLDLAIVATSGVSLEHAFSTPTSSEAEIKRAVIRSAARVVVLCDHTKIGSNYLERFAELTDVSVLVTDAGADSKQIDALRSAGLEVLVAGPDTGPSVAESGASDDTPTKGK